MTRRSLPPPTVLVMTLSEAGAAMFDFTQAATVNAGKLVEVSNFISERARLVD